jgi:hypothetical protein
MLPGSYTVGSAARAAAPPTAVGLLVVLVGGCAPAPVCVPDPAAYEAEIRPRIERYCGTCHGEVPAFGAPFSLLEHDALVAPDALGERIVDRIGPRLFEGAMPPPGMPRVPEADLDAIALWASCGTIDPPPGAGLVSTAPPFLAPEEGPADLETLVIAMDEQPVGEGDLDLYECLVLDLALPEERFVRRFEIVLDEREVLHHVILSRDSERRLAPGSFDCGGGGGVPAGSEYLYTWAPGQAALEFEAGGLRVASGDRFVLQIHYHNGAARPDLRDSSGVRLYLAPPEGPEFGMMAVGPTNFAVPARATSDVRGRCTMREPVRLVAGMPHMHQLGVEFEQTLVRGAARQDLVTLTGWSFESQRFYALERSLAAGDVIETRCRYTSPRAEEVVFGERTEDEMCNGFLYVSPPPSQLYCDEGNPERPVDVPYLPGACVPADAPRDAPLVRGSFEEVTAPPALTPGALADGRYELDAVTLYGAGGETPAGSLDWAASYVLGRGQAILADGVLTFDATFDIVVLLEGGTRFGGPLPQGWSVPFDGTATSVDTAPLCPEGGPAVAFEWGIEGDHLFLGATRSDVPGLMLWPRYQLRRVP